MDNLQETGYKIIDNVLSEEQHKLIENTLIKDSLFPWFLSDDKSSDGELMEIDDLNNYQFTHTFYDNKTINSTYCNNLTFLFDSVLQPLSIIRIKANLTFRTEEIVRYGWHLDFDSNKHKTAIYYVNTNNGKTIFKNGLEVDSVANRLVIFNGDMLHTGTSCTDKKFRCVINLNYIEQ
jgi:hypothetical protein